jgi:hypothetical protein
MCLDIGNRKEEKTVKGAHKEGEREGKRKSTLLRRTAYAGQQNSTSSNLT